MQMLSWATLELCSCQRHGIWAREGALTGIWDSMARFDIQEAMAALQAEAPQWAETALTTVARTMGRDPFKILIGCLLSLRTKDETTGPAATRLFALAGSPVEMLQVPVE